MGYPTDGSIRFWKLHGDLMERHSTVASRSRRSPERWLRSYLRDHFGGSIAAVNIAERRRRAEAPGATRASLDRFIRGVEEDRERLRALMRELGIEPSLLKSAVAVGASWLREAQCATEVSDLRNLRDLELLLMGVRGKELLWPTLERVGILEASSAQVLLERAADQRSILERLHARAAVDAAPAAD